LVFYALAREDYDEATKLSVDYLSATRQLNIAPMRPLALNLSGQALLGAGRLEEAREKLLQARREAEALGVRWHLWQILDTLARLEEIDGNQAEASKLRRQAREIVEAIAGRLPSQEYRDSFLGMPAVKNVMAANGNE